MAAPHDEESHDIPLNERLWDLLVFVPAGIAASVVEDFPSLAERGRQKLGVRVSSARAIGKFAVQAGQDELLRRSSALRHRGSDDATGPSADGGPGAGSGGGPEAGPTPVAPEAVADSGPVATVATPSGPTVSEPTPAPTTVESTGSAPDPTPAPDPGNGHVPTVASLSIPGFDSLSASQVVQRLDGLNRSELVSVRAYEASTRGRRTILSRVDQLLDERS